MRVQVQKWGNSLALRIPKSFAEDAEVEERSIGDLWVGGKAGGTTRPEKAGDPQPISRQGPQREHPRRSRFRAFGWAGVLAAVRRHVSSRGDDAWISFTAQAGHEQAGRYPALVISPAAYNGKVGLAILPPGMRRVKGYAFEVSIPGGLEVGGLILSDQVKGHNWRA